MLSSSAQAGRRASNRLVGVEKLFDESLVKEGSLTRGFTMGTNNDLGMSSRLNLQLSGKLNATTSIMGVISDENIPIQADGTTQRLQEFDRIYLKVFSDAYSLSVGDILLEKPTGYFLNPNKKLKGADYCLNKIDSLGWRNARATLGIAKGRYTRYQFQGQEGVQGPYLLRGGAGEKYIIILSGSERIYVNGKLMQRGEDKDYTIDYNTAQLNFTPNCVMSSEKRIVAEFEFTDQQYIRFAVQASAEYRAAGRDLYVNYYREQDAKGQTVGYSLDDSTKQLFIQATTTDSHFWVNTAQKAAWSSSQNLYALRDTTIGSYRYDSIYVYSTSSKVQLYSLSFTYVGSNKGSYVRADASLNGRFYKWVAPVDGVEQGDYVPMILLAAPQQKDVLSVGMKPLSNNKGFWFEAALSRMNYNTFALSDKVKQLGLALRLNYQSEVRLKDSTQKLSVRESYEFTSKGFLTEGQFRSAEFTRDWSLSDQQAQGLHLLSVGADYKRGKRLSESISLAALLNSSLSNVRISTQAQWMHWLVWERTSNLLLANDSLSQALFLKNRMGVQKPIWKIKLGLNFEQEYKRQIHKQTDSLMASSWRYESIESYLQTTDSTNLLKGSYTFRQDFLPKDNLFLLSSQAQDFTISYKRPKNLFKKTLPFAKSEISLALVFRKLENMNQGSKAPEDHLLGRLEHRLTLFKGLWTSAVWAETSSGLVQKKDFVYVEVPAGQGIYRWTDYNNNGTKELGEFEVAAFKDEAKYIKLFTPTDLYSKAYQAKLSLTARLQPSAVWHGDKGWRKLATKISDQVMIKIDQSLPQRISLPDFLRLSAAASSASASLRNMLLFNRSSSFWSGEYVFQNTNTCSSLASGKESSGLRLHTLLIRLNLSAPSLKLRLPITINQTSNFGNKTYSSESYASRNYNISLLDNELKCSYQISTQASLSANYKYTLKHQIDQQGKADLHLMGLEWKYSRGIKPLSLSLQSSFSKASYTGDESGSLAYTMLEGLKVGNNFLWEAKLDKNITKYFQLSLVYQGRSAPSNPIVHWGSVQAKAYF